MSLETTNLRLKLLPPPGQCLMLLNAYVLVQCCNVVFTISGYENVDETVSTPRTVLGVKEKMYEHEDQISHYQKLVNLHTNGQEQYQKQCICLHSVNVCQA